MSTTISILGGVGLFLLGMTVMTDGLKGLAGSALAMPAAVANTVRFTGLPLGEVLPMASTLPARYIGAVDRNWKPIHVVELPGRSSAAVLRSLR